MSLIGGSNQITLSQNLQGGNINFNPSLQLGEGLKSSADFLGTTSSTPNISPKFDQSLSGSVGVGVGGGSGSGGTVARDESSQAIPMNKNLLYIGIAVVAIGSIFLFKKK